MCMKKIKARKIVSLIMVFTMVLSLVHINVWTITVEAAVTKTVRSATDFGSTETVTIKDKNGSNKNVEVIVVGAGVYTLENDVTIGCPLYVANGVEVTIIFAGNTLSRSLSKAVDNGNIIINEGKLTLGSASDTGYISGGWSTYTGTAVGGIYVYGSSDVEFGSSETVLTNYVNISNNKAYYGGGVAVYNGTFTNYGVIENNESSSNGGGVYAANSTIANYGKIQGNKATNNGGGLYFSESVKFINENIICNNEATYAGGMQACAGSIVENSGEISSNKATSDAGGVYVDGLSKPSKFTNLQNGKILNNKAGRFGAGIYIGRYVECINQGLIDSNSSDSNGGGVSNGNDSHFTNEGTISNNYADTNGGGIYMSNNNASVTNRGKIINNTANNGGGIYCDKSPCTLEDGTVITGNKVKIRTDANGDHESFGGGIYNRKQILVSGKVIVSGNTNISKENKSDNITIETSNGAKVVFLNNLSEESEIGVNSIIND